MVFYAKSFRTCFFAVVSSAFFSTCAMGESPPNPIQPYPEFLRYTALASPEIYFYGSGNSASSADRLEEARRYILELYQGVIVSHSFQFGSDVFDCVPALQQPGARAIKLQHLPSPPPLLPTSNLEHESEIGEAGRGLRTIQMSRGRLDAYGNRVGCSKGEIPMRRITLEQVGRFSSLRDFLQKGFGTTGRPYIDQRDGPDTGVGTHFYAHSTQAVTNIGGSSDINVWDPAINTSTNQIFSLSQQWYSNGTGLALQTVEVGWQVYPAHYSDSLPHLFIYWTADDYQSTGCYNLECKAFVQTNKDWVLGGSLEHDSVNGGNQYYISPGYYLYKGGWWLSINGKWIGYYPVTIFNGGALATSAAGIDYGGEVDGVASWGPMGSGQFASSGWTHAAFQKNISYIDPAGKGAYASLTSKQTSSTCFTNITQNRSNAGGWNTFFFFGGPGGTSC